MMHLGSPSISERVSIAFPPEPPSEDSSVLCLTSRAYQDGKTGDSQTLYLDLRLSLPLVQDSDLNLGFAGLRETLATEPRVRVRWNRTIDSGRDEPDDGAPPDLPDEGDMITRWDPELGREVEVELGKTWNADARKVQDYEEVWSEGDIPSGSEYIFAVQDRLPKDSGDLHFSTTFLARLGHHALALAQEPRGAFQAVRLSQGENGHWSTVYDNTSGSNLYKDVVALVARTHGEKKRGDTLKLASNTKWVVFDVGRA
ncbi:hypothetical protein CONPUDRAFT_139479 [Coniophora puteana RWD-64-598 SS2]|uniref:Protein HRI1 n=1 Tax=Coniophora puteana (strain RWD-64-598) TaxID=741705 RepID=A0A5M3MCR5_CONPW|nr:uncharacterized protein CONPUDRAFT_139479 [Coniophora puteana RWD-64-598 SS2]EIW76826.1 hypothetical protein CONPUDRAFT_139479 [Coniophora puteana RWD-64-598 SS2]